MITRRGLLAGILAAGVAPAAVGSQILMPVRRLIAPDQSLIDKILECTRLLDEQDAYLAANPPLIIGVDYGRGDYTVLARGSLKIGKHT